ncbi:MAG: hypothetical protein ABGX27_04935, partial [Desulfurobacteriaceae bacterium]
MTKNYKLSLISFITSLIIHGALISILSISGVLKIKTYKMVDILPLSFDLKVESELIGEKSRKGDKSFKISSAQNTSSPKGRKTEKKKTKKAASLKTSKRKITKSDTSESAGMVSASKLTVSKKVGNGELELSLFVDSLKNKENKKLPAIAASKLVPYLKKV